MAVPRRSGNRFSGSIWPGFVDALTALLLILMFVLSIFMIVQGVLRDTISGQESELDELERAQQKGQLTDADLANAEMMKATISMTPNTTNKAAWYLRNSESGLAIYDAPVQFL